MHHRTGVRRLNSSEPLLVPMLDDLHRMPEAHHLEQWSLTLRNMLWTELLEIWLNTMFFISNTEHKLPREKQTSIGSSHTAD